MATPPKALTPEASPRHRFGAELRRWRELRGLSQRRPERLVLAVPVAPADSLGELAAECDEIVCLATPEPFFAVGTHYRNFTQTEDDEVIRLLGEARKSLIPPANPAG